MGVEGYALLKAERSTTAFSGDINSAAGAGSRCLYVGNLDYAATEEQLMSFLSDYDV